MVYCRVLVLVVLLYGVGGFVGTPNWAQDETSGDGNLHTAMSSGIEALQQDGDPRAIRLLEDVLLDTLGYVDPTYGAGAYWLGRAYEETGQIEKAVRLWRSGLITLQATDQFSIPMADAFIHHTFARQDRDNYGLATNVYLEILKRIGTDTSTVEAQGALVRRLRHLALVIPRSERREAGLPPTDEEIVPQVLTSIDGSSLVQWWRAEDPLPGTLPNEQLREHLQRVAHSLDEYGHPETIYGFDDRGKVYVRLGPPDENVTINYSQSKLTDIIFEKKVGVDVNISDFPENEFWTYGQYDRRIYYIFAERERGGPFRISRTRDLLPRSLQGPFNTNTQRGYQRSIYALAVLRAIFRKYKPFHPNLATRHDEVANYLSFATTGGLEQFEAANDRSPDVFASQTLREIQNDDEVAARRREEYAPNQLSTTERETPDLNVAARTARFLNNDGTTRTEVYWAPEEDAVLPSSDQRDRLREKGYPTLDEYLIRFTATQETADYRRRVVNREHYRIRDVREGEAMIPARTFTTERGDSSLYHLSMQWDQYLVDSAADSVGPKVKMATERRDSLQALPRDESTLVMSDVRAMVLPDGQTTLESAIPYPFSSVTPTTSLALYFEVYHLPFSANDRTEYTVEYEIKGQKDRGKIAEFFLGDKEERTTVETTHQGSSRKAEEYIVLDLSEWEGQEGTDITVTVRITDETSGQQVERGIAFRLVSP